MHQSNDPLGAVIDIFFHASAGWRYLFSSSYRRETHARWRAEGALTAFFEFVGGAFAMLLAPLLLGLGIFLVVDWLRGWM